VPKNIPNQFFDFIDNLNEKDKEMINKYFEEEFKIYLNSEEYIGQIGATIYDMLTNEDIKLFIENKKLTKEKKKNIYVSISNEYIEFLFKKIFIPRKLPMIIIPQK
jgi:hypothetical protein